MAKSVAVMGAGPAGLFTLLGFEPLAKKGEVEIVAFEKYHDVGGQWNFCADIGPDRWGDVVHGSMYANLQNNVALQCLELPDFRFPDGVSYTSRDVIENKMKAYFQQHDVLKHVLLNTRVESVQYDAETEKFKVSFRQFQCERKTREFDYVIVATGHFTYPNEPNIEGMETFPGEAFHSHFFRDANRYKGKRVLCIGGSYSAEDISMQCWKAGAASVTVSARKPTPYKWPEGVTEKPAPDEVRGSSVAFSDGSSSDFDVIIKCTGYLHKFDFLAPELRLIAQNTFSVPLYRQVIFPDNTKLLYVGMQNLAFAFPLFCLQGLFCAKYIQGQVPLPSKEAMLFDIECERKLEAQLATINDIVDFQRRHLLYYREVTNGPDVDVSRQFKESIDYRFEDIATFRTKLHASHYD